MEVLLVCVGFILLVAIFLVYQQRRSGWTAGDFFYGMFGLMKVILLFLGEELFPLAKFRPGGRDDIP